MPIKTVPYTAIHPDGWVEICCGEREPHVPHLSYEDGAWACEGRDNCKKCHLNAATVLSASGFPLCIDCGEFEKDRFYWRRVFSAPGSSEQKVA